VYWILDLQKRLLLETLQLFSLRLQAQQQLLG